MCSFFAKNFFAKNFFAKKRFPKSHQTEPRPTQWLTALLRDKHGEHKKNKNEKIDTFFLAPVVIVLTSNKLLKEKIKKQQLFSTNRIDFPRHGRKTKKQSKTIKNVTVAFFNAFTKIFSTAATVKPMSKKK